MWCILDDRDDAGEGHRRRRMIKPHKKPHSPETSQKSHTFSTYNKFPVLLWNKHNIVTFICAFLKYTRNGP